GHRRGQGCRRREGRHRHRRHAQGSRRGAEERLAFAPSELRLNELTTATFPSEGVAVSVSNSQFPTSNSEFRPLHPKRSTIEVGLGVGSWPVGSLRRATKTATPPKRRGRSCSSWSPEPGAYFVAPAPVVFDFWSALARLVSSLAWSISSWNFLRSFSIAASL